MLGQYKKELYQQYKYLNPVNHSETNEMIDLKAELKNLRENFEKNKTREFDVNFSI